MSEQDNFEQVPDESEQLDQLDADDTLIDRGQPDPLDEGYTAPDRWSAAEGYGNTAYEMEQGETLDQRLAEENPDVGPGSFGGDGSWEAEQDANDPGTTNVLAYDEDEGRDGALPGEVEGDFGLEDEGDTDELADEVGSIRAGRLVDPSTVDGEDGDFEDDLDGDSDVYGEDVGLSGGAASAEEAAMNIFDPDA